MKGEDAERCSPNHKIQLGLNIGTRLPAMIRNHLTVPSWTYSVVVSASNHHHSHDIMTIMLVKTSHRALLDIFSSGPSLDPGITKSPHQRRCWVPSNRGAPHLCKSAIWRLILIITILITFFRQEQLTAASSFGERQNPLLIITNNIITFLMMKSKINSPPPPLQLALEVVLEPTENRPLTMRPTLEDLEMF